MGRRLGLIIGINQYQDATFRPLQFAENDGRALAQWLVNTKGGKWAPGDVQYVYGSHATRELMEALVTQTCIQIAEPGDLVFIYFAGHAFLDERSGEGYLALANTHYQEPSTALHLQSLVQQIVGCSRATHILLFLDCFQTGRLWKMRRASPYDSSPLLGPALPGILQHQTNRLLLCSCRGNEMALEAGERNLGILTYRIILGLCGPAGTSSTEPITLQQLHSYLHNNLSEQQRPHLFGQGQSSMILIGEMTSTSHPIQGTNAPKITQTFSPSVVVNPPNTPPFTPPGQFMRRSAQAASVTAQLSPQPPDPPTSGVYSNQEQQTAQLLHQTRQFLQNQQYPEALNMVEQACLIAPYHIPALTLKGQILGSMGRFPEALAVVEQLLQANPNNALTWSMRAVLLCNMGQYQGAHAAIERSLELNPGNPETHAIKTNIMTNIAGAQSKESGQQQHMSASVQEKQSRPHSFVIDAIIQIVGLLMGIAGMALPILQPHLPVTIGFFTASLGMALLCVNAARGAYRHGFLHLLFTLFLSLVVAGIVGIVSIRYSLIIETVQQNPQLIVPILFFPLWLITAATIPLLLALGGFVSGLVLGIRKKR